MRNQLQHLLRAGYSPLRFYVHDIKKYFYLGELLALVDLSLVRRRPVPALAQHCVQRPVSADLTVVRAQMCGLLLQTVKMGVQYSLWGGSILNLGTEAHRKKYFEDIDKFRLPGGCQHGRRPVCWGWLRLRLLAKWWSRV